MTSGAVTLADLFRVLSAMQADLAKMTTQMEVINIRNVHADEVDRDHETRLRSLEAFRWKLAGMAVTVGALSGSVAALIVWALSRR